MDFSFENMHDILSFAMPGLYIADNTTLNIKINDRGRLSGGLNSQRIAFQTQYIKDMSLDFDNND